MSENVKTQWIVTLDASLLDPSPDDTRIITDRLAPFISGQQQVVVLPPGMHLFAVNTDADGFVDIVGTAAIPASRVDANFRGVAIEGQ